MTDRKISELEAATTVATSDTFVLVQSGETKKVPASVVFGNIPVKPVCKETPEVVASGVISPTALTTVIDSAVAENITLTLAAGTAGHEKEIFVKNLSPTKTAIITVTGGTGYSTITFSNSGQSVLLKNILGDWYVVSYRGAQIA